MRKRAAARPPGSSGSLLPGRFISPRSYTAGDLFQTYLSADSTVELTQLKRHRALVMRHAEKHPLPQQEGIFNEGIAVVPTSNG
jgi:hypothetical protein